MHIHRTQQIENLSGQNFITTIIAWIADWNAYCTQAWYTFHSLVRTACFRHFYQESLRCLNEIERNEDFFQHKKLAIMQHYGKLHTYLLYSNIKLPFNDFIFSCVWSFAQGRIGSHFRPSLRFEFQYELFMFLKSSWLDSVRSRFRETIILTSYVVEIQPNCTQSRFFKETLHSIV